MPLSRLLNLLALVALLVTVPVLSGCAGFSDDQAQTAHAHPAPVRTTVWGLPAHCVLHRSPTMLVIDNTDPCNPSYAQIDRAINATCRYGVVSALGDNDYSRDTEIFCARQGQTTRGGRR